MLLQMLNVSALITNYETVGDHTEFVTQVHTHTTQTSGSRMLVAGVIAQHDLCISCSLLHVCVFHRCRAMAKCGSCRAGSATLINCTRAL